MGSFRRLIQIASIGDSARSGEARAVLEDDFHHFRVRIRHEDGRVVDIAGESPRFPYSTCPAAAGQLTELLGRPLAATSAAIFRGVDARLHCTHMLDLAGFAIAAAARDIRARRYDIEAPDRVDGLTDVIARRDNVLLPVWRIDLDDILSPERFAGAGYRQGFAKWVADNLPSEDDAEAAFVMRRCAMICVGRTRDLDNQVHADPLGHCYSQQPERVLRAARIKGSIRDFSVASHPLCADDAEWIAMAD